MGTYLVLLQFYMPYFIDIHDRPACPFLNRKRRSILGVGERRDRGVKEKVLGEEEGGEITNGMLKINK